MAAYRRDDHQVDVWNLEKKKLLDTLPSHRKAPPPAISRDGTFVAVAEATGDDSPFVPLVVRLYRRGKDSYEQVGSILGKGYAIDQMRFAADRLFTTGRSPDAKGRPRNAALFIAEMPE